MFREPPEIAVKIYEILSNFIIDLETHWEVKKHLESLSNDSVSKPLWILFSNNCLMMAAVEWCKVFGSERNNKTHYTTCIEKLEGIDETVEKIKDFRDRYISHYDDYNDPIPFMDAAVVIVRRFDQAMLDRYDSGNIESTTEYITRNRADIQRRLAAIISGKEEV